MDSFIGVHADELSRRISELDLTSLRRPTVTHESGPRYTAEELLNFRPEHEDHHDHLAALEGMKTPPEVHPPPPTPHHELNVPDKPLADVEKAADAPSDAPIKKKKKKSSGKNKKPAPTGFEEFYADPPTTPDEHEEESELYNISRSFSERIQTCIQRYRKRRNLDSIRSNILTKYLMLGGVEASTTKQFTGGLDKETLQNSTAQEIAAIQATDFIRAGNMNAKYFDPSDPENWVVDFEGVAKGFFSCTAPKRLPTDTEQDIKGFCAVVRNFLNYVLTHAVCPEYTEDVMAARRVCNLAEKELWEIKQVRHKFPGEFNVAASTLYGGRYQDLYPGDDDQWGAEDASLAEQFPLSRGFNIPEAERIFKTAVAFEGTEELFLEAMNGDIRIVKTDIKGFEVVRIDRAEMTSIDDYAKVKNHLGISGSIKALGRIHLKPWSGPGMEEEDVTDSEDEACSPLDQTVETFWLEDEILHHCFLGMKLELVVHELNIGIRFFDDVAGIYCSFHTFLPNEKVIDNWKEPVPNTRAPPTEDDPDAEENAMGAEMERELEADALPEIKNTDSKPAAAS